MKKILFIIGIAILTVSCKKENPVDYALISGKFLNNKDKKIILLSFNDRSFKDTIQVSSDGSFKDTIRGKKGLYQMIYNKMRTNIHLEKGYDLTLNADSKALDSTVAISGNGAEENNFLRARTKKAKEIDGAEKIYTLKQDVFKDKMNTSISSLTELLGNTKGISESFRIAQQKDIKYTYLNRMANFESNHAYYTKNKDFKVPSDFLNDLENIDYDNEEDYINSRAYKSLVSNYYKNKAAEIKTSENISEDIAALKAFSTAKTQTIKNDLLSSTIASITRTEHLDEYYNLFMAASTDKKQKETIAESYRNLKKVQAGNPSPKFENYVNYAGGTTSLDDLKGKYVYIDVWATWCRPCIGEIPALKEIEKKYHGKNIEFVSISVDRQSSYEKWKKMVKDKELGGVQLFADNDFKSKFMKDYVINGIPKFILLDPKGNIVNANAPRPSDSKLITLFNELGI
ncbi:TlpA family protein disulfide reductase [Polaribacter sp. Hel1_85]|uniref:TlpA family protein disulfide reductase n=1 Tax=Polaribacter sp. Hel1_85 TaxID=1250005 RepID=UPI00052C3683|nr:TlpA disulfide reductase family protein [Polaribacter sp. Hel1_85]KGL58774.1 thiol:disulfide interchange protein [Polaribacter sp. Hel1_85]